MKRLKILNLPPEYHLAEFSDWTTISLGKNGPAMVRLVWADDNLFVPKKGAHPLVVVYTTSEVRWREIPFDTPEDAVRYVETMCALNTWEN